MVYADYFEGNKAKVTIVLFHQAGSNARGEYGPIVPVLIKEGYNVLAVDQRSGGERFGFSNRTSAVFEDDPGYCSTRPDMQGALDYLKEKSNGKGLIIWGSSYSAGLLFELGRKNPNDVKALVACSPASSGPMEPCDPNRYMAEIKVPVMLLRPKKEMEYPPVKEQFERAKDLGFFTYVAAFGVHGSSMFVEDRTKSSTIDAWNALWKFLSRI